MPPVKLENIVSPLSKQFPKVIIYHGFPEGTALRSDPLIEWPAQLLEHQTVW